MRINAASNVYLCRATGKKYKQSKLIHDCYFGKKHIGGSQFGRAALSAGATCACPAESERLGELGAALEPPARGAFDLRDPAHFPPMRSDPAAR